MPNGHFRGPPLLYGAKVKIDWDQHPDRSTYVFEKDRKMDQNPNGMNDQPGNRNEPATAATAATASDTPPKPIEQRFFAQPMTPEDMGQLSMFRDYFAQLCHVINKTPGNPRLKAIAQTHLETSAMFVTKMLSHKGVR